MFFLVNLPLWRQALRGLGAVLCNVIYNLISWIYQLFMVVAQLNILSEGTTHEIYQRVTMILTIVMTFYITFEFVKYTINPDTFTDKDKGVGNILQRMVIVVVLIAFVPEIFSLAYQGQSAIIKNQVFSKIILGKKDINTEKFGGDFSANILGLFYELDEECTNGNNCQEASDAVTTNLKNLRENGSVNILDGINTPSETGGSSLSFDGTPAIHFNGILAIIVGGFIVYMLVLYSIDVGVRYAQLIFLQLIAPIAIMGYILPKKDGIFQKWTKQCITTYIDLFIRIAIIYFVILLIQTLGSPETGEIFASLDGVSKTLRVFAYVVLVMGLLVFAQRAPKLLGELLPGGGAGGIGFGMKWADRIAPATARAVGATLGATKAGGAIARRAINAHNRNKANGQKSLLTAEGRAQRKQRIQNRRNARDLADLSDRTNELNEAEDRLVSANKKLKAAQAKLSAVGGNTEENRREYNRLLGERNDALRNYQGKYASYSNNEVYKNDLNSFKSAGNRLTTARNELNAAIASGDATRIAAARKELYAAETHFNEQRSNMSKYDRTTAENREKNKINERELIRRTSDLSTAERELNDAIASGDKAWIADAQKNFNDAQKNYNDIRDNYFTNDNLRKQFAEDLKSRADAAKEQVVIDNSTAHRSVVGETLGGVGAGIKIMAAGAGATKLEDVNKKVNEAVKKDVQHVADVNKYYDSGGAGGIEGLVNRTVQQVEKKMGIETQYQRTVLNIQALEPKIKNLEAKSSLTKDIKSTADGVEDRLKDKIGELKQKTDANTKIPTGLSGSEEYAEITPGETLADVYRKYVGRAENAQAVSDAVTRRYEEYISTNSDILSKDRNTLSGADLANYDSAVIERDKLKAESESKAKAAADYKFAVTQIQKNAARYQFTSILKDMANGMSLDAVKAKNVYDAVAVEKVQDSLESLKVARQNPEIVADMRERLKATPQYFEEFLSGKITSFDALDKIKTAAINAGNAYERDLKDYKEQKRRAETSAQTAAEKAATDFNGGNK